MHMRIIKNTALALLLSSSLIAGEQFAMSDADRAMYEEMLENNPAEIFVEEGGELLESQVGGQAALAEFLGVKEADLPKYIAGFPRYVEKVGAVLGLNQVIQALYIEKGVTPPTLDGKKGNMFAIEAYVKSIANGEKMNVNVIENEEMRKLYALGEQMFMTKRGGRGLSCYSCHSPDIVGSVLRTQPLPDLGAVGAAATWPAYRMTKSSLRTLQRRFQGCMQNALLAVIPIGSKEMLALEIYVSHMARGKEIQIPGLKR